MTAILELQNIEKSYVKNQPFLRDVFFKLQEGEIYALVGPNGSGKTTLLKVIVGLCSVDGGNIVRFGQTLWNESLQKQMAFIQETPEFPDFLSAQEYLLFSAKLYGFDKKKSLLRMGQVLSQVGLAQKEKIKIAKYSKGMKRRLGLAQALLSDAAFLIFDEPLDGLDPMGIQFFTSLVRDLKQKGKTILITTHLLSDIENYADRIGFMKEGKLVKEITKNEILGQKALPELYCDIYTASLE